MRNHNGMRPHDVVVLLKLLSFGNSGEENKGITNKSLAESLKISQAEITHSLKRSSFAGLLEPIQKRVNKQSLLDFLKYGIKCVFPDQPGKLIRGIPTAHSAKPLSEKITSSENFVWPTLKGNTKGQEITPLYSKVSEVVGDDLFLYQTLALIDSIRVGKNREYKLASIELEKLLFSDEK
jgi:hypothetical protein